MTVRFNALVPGDDAEAVRAAIERVISSGWFVLGPEVEAFETEFAAACGARYAVGVNTGTDALALSLRALGSRAGTDCSGCGGIRRRPNPFRAPRAVTMRQAWHNPSQHSMRT